MGDRDRAYFDGRCGMCRRTARVLRRLDWLDWLEFVDMTSVPEDRLPVKIDDALRGMPLRTAGGKTLVGFPAVRRALLQTPLGALPAALLYLPGVAQAGRAVYDQIARRRRREACELDVRESPMQE